MARGRADDETGWLRCFAWAWVALVLASAAARILDLRGLELALHFRGPVF